MESPARLRSGNERCEMISLPAGEREEIVRLILSGSKVAAVAKVRQLTGAGLKDAKDYVDSLAAKFGRD